MLLGAVFVYAGVIKTLDPAQFAVEIQNYRLVPWPIAAAMSLYLPWLEIACGTALLLPRGARGALWIVTGLTVIFLIALISAKLRGLNLSCGCFGHASGDLNAALFRDVVLLAAAGILLRGSQATD